MLVPFEMATIEETEIAFQENENAAADGSTDLTSFQFVPDKIIDFTISQVRYWKLHIAVLVRHCFEMLCCVAMDHSLK